MRASAQAEAAAAGDARALSTLEALHPDALEAVLLQLGPVEATRALRRVSRKMREAVDRVAAWPSLQLKANSLATINLAAACFVRPRQAGRTPRLRLAAGGTLELSTWLDNKSAARVERFEAISALFSACSASSGSGGISSVSLVVDMSSALRYAFESCINQGAERLSVNEGVWLAMKAMLDPLSAPESDGRSCQTLRSVSVKLEWGLLTWPFPEALVGLLSRFPRLERLAQPFLLDASASAMSAALPALRSATVHLDNGAALADLAAHPALEELEVSVMEFMNGDDRGSARGFDRFAAGAAGGRLRTLSIPFCSDFGTEYDVGELPALGRLKSLEKLKLNINFYVDLEEEENEQDGGSAQGGGEGGAAGQIPRLDAYLGGLDKFRALDLHFTFLGLNGAISPAPGHLRGLARLFRRLCQSAHYSVTSRLFIPLETPCAAEVDAALAELLRAAGPALADLHVSGPLARGEAFAALAACTQLQALRLLDRPGRPEQLDSRWRPEPPGWLARGDHGTLAALRRLRKLDFDLAGSAHLEAGHLRCLAAAFASLCAHSLADLKLKIFTDEEPGVDAALAELLRAAAPALVKLAVGAAVLRGEAAAALATCRHLKKLTLFEPGVPDTPWEPVPVAQAAGALAACPALEVVRGLIVLFDDERGATEGLEPLCRLAAARKFIGPRCLFVLRPGPGLQSRLDEEARVVELAKARVWAAFPKASMETPAVTFSTVEQHGLLFRITNPRRGQGPMMFNRWDQPP
eukprot:tig00000350_g24338.t1